MILRFLICSLVTVDIPASVTSMSGNSFGSVVNLMEINVDEANPNYSSVGGVLYSKDGSTLVTWPGGNTNISIPSSVTTIGSYAFYCYYRADEIEIPNTVTTIGDFAFQSSTVERIGVPASVTEIGDGAFSFCSYLTSIDVEASNPVFSSADGVIYNKDKTTLVAWPYAKTDVEIPSSVTKIGDYAFYYCMNISSIDFPSSLTEIGNYAFVMCSGLTSLDFHWEIPVDTDTYVASQVITDAAGRVVEQVPAGVYSVTHVFGAGEEVTANSTYTLTITDSAGSVIAAKAEVRFVQKIYWGTSASSTLTTSAEIIALQNNDFMDIQSGDAYDRTFSFDASGGRYIYFAIPKAFGVTIDDFMIGNFFNNNWEVLDEFDFTNESGETQKYMIFKLRDLQHAADIEIRILHSGK